MALIKCPECGRDVSDMAKSCPNCGYVLPNKRIMLKNVTCPECKKMYLDAGNGCPYCGYKISHPVISDNQKRIIIRVGVIAVILILAIVLIPIMSKETCPFEKFKEGMTRKDVREVYGNPYRTSNTDEVDIYNNISFMGLKGELSVWYDENLTIKYIYWEYELSDGETFADYKKEIEKIKEFYTDKYGEPEDEYKGSILWMDVIGQRYSLYLDNLNLYSTPYTIELEYEP